MKCKTATLPERDEIAERLKKAFPGNTEAAWEFLRLEKICQIFEQCGSAAGASVGTRLDSHDIARKYTIAAMNILNIVGAASFRFFVGCKEDIILSLVEDDELAKEIASLVEKELS